ncbi:hypothetical protein GGS20DRAFT_468334 [Poronia punctata]|nr:hypothetical protein GGS20DRAFT_468334 [Poronia punctata]
MADIPTSNGVMTTNSTGLADLPLELILKIFRDTLLNSGRDLHNLTITCKALHFTFKCHQKYILSVILDEQSDEDLAMSSARYHAAMAPWRDVKDFEAPALRNLPAYHRHVKEFCSDHISRQGTQLTIPRSLFTLGMVTHFQEHHPPIQRMAAELVKLVVEGRVDPRPSSAEVRRVVKSLWILDLVQILFPKTWAPGTTLQEDPISPFWSCFAPWESDQVQWVADRLADNLRCTFCF